MCLNKPIRKYHHFVDTLYIEIQGVPKQFMPSYIFETENHQLHQLQLTLSKAHFLIFTQLIIYWDTLPLRKATCSIVNTPLPSVLSNTNSGSFTSLMVRPVFIKKNNYSLPFIIQGVPKKQGLAFW